MDSQPAGLRGYKGMGPILRATGHQPVRLGTGSMCGFDFGRPSKGSQNGNEGECNKGRLDGFTAIVQLASLSSNLLGSGIRDLTASKTPQGPRMSF